MKVWIVHCMTSKGVLYERRPYLSEAKMRESLAYLKRRYPSRSFEVNIGYVSHVRKEGEPWR